MSATHVFELFKDENSWVAEVSSDCVNYIPGHIDTKYLDQASWIYDRMAASQRLKLSRLQQWNRPDGAGSGISCVYLCPVHISMH